MWSRGKTTMHKIKRRLRVYELRVRIWYHDQCQKWHSWRASVLRSKDTLAESRQVESDDRDQ